MTDLFDAVRDQVQIDPDKDYHSELVGEGKRYKDEKSLARAAVEKDAHIARLEAEQAALREELGTRAKLEEIADRIASQPAPSLSNDDTNRQEREVREPVQVDLNKLLDDKFIEVERKRTEATNLGEVIQKLSSLYGPDYPARLRQHATELGVGPEFLNSMAKQNPKAFFKLVGLQDQPAHQELFTPPTSSVNSDAMTMRSPTEKTQRYYKELQKKDPKNFYTPRVQMELHNNAIKLGERFFDA